MKNKQILGTVLLMTTAVIWGTAFVAQQVGMEELGPFSYASARFFLGTLFLAGLWLLRQPRALLLAFLIALFDLFPVVGAGLILLPWAVVTLVGGAFAKGLGLLALWIIVIVLRQIIEPRIVGRSVGLHPLVTLMSMFVGAKLFGGIGLFGLPISCAIVKSLDDGGIIHILKREEPVFVAVEEKNEKSSKTRREGY